jgi:hypothetical protein
MEDLFQLALAVFFAAALLVTGQLFMEYSSSGPLDEPSVAAVLSQVTK